MLFTVKDLIPVIGLPLIIYLANAFLLIWFPTAYEALGLDSWLHFLGGLSIAASAGYTFKKLSAAGVVIIKNRLWQAIVLVAIVTLAAALWEGYEFLHDRFLGTHWQPSNADTMKDLFFGMLGGALYCLTPGASKTTNRVP